MDEEEQSIVEEYASSLEDLTFNSKPLINMLTMIAEENSRFASSVTKLIEERIYKVPQQHKLPSLYLLDSIIKNVGGTYLNVIAQVLVKVFVSVFEKGDEKTRKDLYKLRHTWPQYFSAKVLHDLDVNINKLDPGWPITAVPPPSPSIHVNPKFLKKTEVTVAPIVHAVLPEVSKEEERQVLVEHQKRLAELQRLQEEQLRLTEQEIQEHQLKRDLILKKQEQERKALLTQQQKMLLNLRLESELEELVNSSEKTSLKILSTKAEMTQPSHSITSSRDPRLQRQEQALPNNNNKASQQQKQKHNELNHRPTIDPRDKANYSKTNQNKDKTETLPNNKRKSRSQSPVNEREKKFLRHDGRSKNMDIWPEPEKFQREERPPKRRRSLDGTDSGVGKKREFPDWQGPGEHRGYRGRGDKGRGFRGGRGRDRIGSKTSRDDQGKHGKGPRTRADDPRQRFHPEGRNSPHIQTRENVSEKVPDLLKPKPLLSNEEVQEIRAKDNVPENATIPQELTLEHKSIILEEAKRRLEAGHISQEQYIELIDKLAEFYELQRQQELEAVSEIPAQINAENPEQIYGPQSVDPRNQNGRGERPGRMPRQRRPNEGNRHALLGDGPRRRDGPSIGNHPSPSIANMPSPPRLNQSSSLIKGPPMPNRIPRMEDQKRDSPHSIRIDGTLVQRLPAPPEHLQHHPLFNLDHHQIDEGPSIRFIPPNIDNRDQRGPGPHQRYVEEPHFRGEVLVDNRGHPLQELPSFGHGRPVEHFQGQPAGHHGQPPGHHGQPDGPAHELPPHIRTTQAGGIVHHIEGPSHHPGEPDIIRGHRPLESVHPGHHPSEASIRPIHRPSDPGVHIAQLTGQPGIHPGLQPPHPDIHPRVQPPVSGLHQVEELGRLPEHHPVEVGPQGVMLGPNQQGPSATTGHGGSATMHLLMPSQGSPLRQDTSTPPPSISANTPPTPSRMDKKTVDDLFSRLVQVGIIKVAEEQSSTPPRIGTPPIIQPHPLQHPLPPSSIAQPIPLQPPQTSQPPTMTPMNLHKLQQMIAKSKEATTVIPKIELNTNDLKRRHQGIIVMLYKGTQCSSCGLRFDGEAEAFYREHLDWHFRRNRREKDGKRIAHRQWYIPLKDWLEYEEITDPEEKAHSSFFDAEKPDTDTNLPRIQDSEGSCPVLPGDTEAEMVCDICQEKFEQFWEETQEEWHYKEAIRVGGKTYHEMCYQDAKSNVEEAATQAIVDNSKSEQEPSKGPTKVKKEDPQDKAEDGTTTQISTVKSEEGLSKEVKTEDGNKIPCSVSVQSNDEVLKQSDVAINESEVKLKPTENNHSLINTEQNKVDTISDDDKSGTADQ